MNQQYPRFAKTPGDRKAVRRWLVSGLCRILVLVAIFLAGVAVLRKTPPTVTPPPAMADTSTNIVRSGLVPGVDYPTNEDGSAQVAVASPEVTIVTSMNPNFSDNPKIGKPTTNSVSK